MQKRDVIIVSIWLKKKKLFSRREDCEKVLQIIIFLLYIFFFNPEQKYSHTIALANCMALMAAALTKEKKIVKETLRLRLEFM